MAAPPSSSSATPPSDSPLDHALALAALGLRVHPIRPGAKHPPMNSWQHAATSDPKTIRSWWTGLYRDHGVGLAMGEQPDGRRIFALDIDEHSPEASGSDTLHELEQLHGELPDTVMSLTGSGGQHLLFDSGDVEVTNGGASRVGPGIDVRGQGGQIVVAPSTHPNGHGYSWEFAPWERTIARAPAWLLELVKPAPVAATTPSPERNDSRSIFDSSPADQLRQDWDWPEELRKRGWTLHSSHSNGDTHWTRPGKDKRDGNSAVLHPNGVFVIMSTDASMDTFWTTGTPTVDNLGVSMTPFNFLAASDHGGDKAAAFRALQPEQISPSTSAQDVEGDPFSDLDTFLMGQLLDWDEFWKGGTTEEWLAQPIIAAKRSHSMFAKGGTGKSLLALWLSAALAAGKPIFGRTRAPLRVLYLDYEMTDDDLRERLESMGYGPDSSVQENLYYALLPSLPGLDEEKGGEAIVRLAELVDAQLVVIDTFSRAVHGDENEADTVRAWYRHTGLKLKQAGRAFLRIDHSGKDVEKGQRGTSAKNDDVDVVWQLEPRDDDRFTLKAVKRRMGWVPPQIDLMRREDDEMEYVMLSDGGGYPAGTAEVVRRLEELGVPASAGQARAAKAYREAGGSAKSAVIRAAQKSRREAVDNSFIHKRTTVPDGAGTVPSAQLCPPAVPETQNPCAQGVGTVGHSASSPTVPVPAALGRAQGHRTSSETKRGRVF